jgi:hypothetical protein
MKTTTYKCDRCGAEDTDNQIGLNFIKVGYGQYITDASCRPMVEWCHKCRIETGLQKPSEKMPGVKPGEPPPTLEEMIREIVREEMENA